MDGVIDVSICVCTYRRPAGLLRLLRSLHQLDPSSPTREIIVVDNDAAGTAAPAVKQARDEGIVVHHAMEPIRGIARARNRSVALATGTFVAFIDDDEVADRRWLLSLWEATIRHGVDGAVGPVLPSFAEGTPSWLIEGGFFERLRLPTGTELIAQQTRAGNALVRRSALLTLEGPFDERYNAFYGDDTDLFARLIGAGYRFIAVDSAIVHEHLPRARTRVWWLVRRRFQGAIGAARLDFGGVPPRGERHQSARLLAQGIGLGLVGLLVFPASRRYGLDRLTLAARRLGRVGFINGLTAARYIDD